MPTQGLPKLHCKSIVLHLFVVTFCVSYAQQTLADPLKFALVSADITPPQMDYYQDLNQNQRFDADEP